MCRPRSRSCEVRYMKLSNRLLDLYVNIYSNLLVNATKSSDALRYRLADQKTIAATAAAW